MKTGHQSLLSILSDGELHSGESLAVRQNISRTAVWKSIKQLESLGLHIHAECGKGYQLNRPIELLSKEEIKALLPASVKRKCAEIDVLFKTDSTNSILVNKLEKQDIHGQVIFAEYQSQGRGRRGKNWIAPFASGIMFSIGWRFEVVPKTIGLLSLCTGVAVVRTLQSFQINNIGLKWPNDILVSKEKLGGILIEVRGEASGPIDVIVGIGLNYDLPKEIRAEIKQPVTDISTHSDDVIPRNKIAASLLSNVIDVLNEMEDSDCSELLEEWRLFDFYKEQQAKLILPNEEIEGIVQGIDDEGALLMSVSGSIKRFNAGEISLRVSA